MTVYSRTPFSKLEEVPPLVRDFLNGSGPVDFPDIFSRSAAEKKTKEKSKSYTHETRALLCEILTEQHSGDCTPAQTESLSLLAKPNTFTVTTGHQLNLFGGPAFFIYKILQCIQTVRELSASLPDYRFVPVFWMASEDHDFEEVKFFKTKNTVYNTEADSGGAVGRILITDLSFIDEFENEFQDAPFGTELVQLLRSCYQPGSTFSRATRCLVQRLFGKYGLLIIDGDDARLKAQMHDIFADELISQTLQNSTLETVETLKNTYGKVQVNPREINLFYLTESRNRIIAENQGFKIDGTDVNFSKSEILQQLKSNPERFSPNAVLRPAYQEKILPNIAYIGGNAEIMYWLELKNYFREINLPFPLLIPRSSVLNMSTKTLNRVEKSGLSFTEFFGNFEETLNTRLRENSSITAQLNILEGQLLKQFEILTEEAEKTNKTFRNLVTAEQVRQLKSFKRMRKRLLRAERIRREDWISRMRDLHLEIHPRGIWQERVFNFSVYYAEYGPQWLECCLESLDAWKSELIVMEL